MKEIQRTANSRVHFSSQRNFLKSITTKLYKHVVVLFVHYILEEVQSIFCTVTF